jgi:hypothetical protein
MNYDLITKHNEDPLQSSKSWEHGFIRAAYPPEATR